MDKKNQFGFTLIEVMVAISIVAILTVISLSSISGVRKSSRDGKRKADLEQVRSALEIYRSDCSGYPASLPTPGSALVGSGSGNCLAANTYLSSMPDDPVPGTYKYYYNRSGTNTYSVCAYLELLAGSPTPVACSTAGVCGTGVSCNYRQTNP